MKKFIIIFASFLLINTKLSFAITCNTGSYYNSLDDYQETTIDDPLILLNKYMFTFNMLLDALILEPVAKTYVAIVPVPAQKHVSSVFQNINTPLSAASHVLMGDFKNASQSLVRFLVNSTLGFGGMMDVAKDFGLKGKKANFTSVLEKWGVPDGPYLMLPLLGPSTLTSAAATFGEIKVYPTTKFYKKHKIVPAVKAVSQRARMRDVFDKVKNSIDPYTSAKSQYIQYRCKDKQPSYE
jgi:phospholipid-binding lipoprotein MlaA